MKQTLCTLFALLILAPSALLEAQEQPETQFGMVLDFVQPVSFDGALIEQELGLMGTISVPLTDEWGVFGATGVAFSPLRLSLPAPQGALGLTRTLSERWLLTGAGFYQFRPKDNVHSGAAVLSPTYLFTDTPFSLSLPLAVACDLGGAGCVAVVTLSGGYTF